MQVVEEVEVFQLQQVNPQAEQVVEEKVHQHLCLYLIWMEQPILVVEVEEEVKILLIVQFLDLQMIHQVEQVVQV